MNNILNISLLMMMTIYSKNSIPVYDESSKMAKKVVTFSFLILIWDPNSRRLKKRVSELSRMRNIAVFLHEGL